LVARRLTVSLTLLACLLGIVQPALACVSQSDCCQSGCGQPVHSGAGWIEVVDCCVTAAVGSSVSIAAQPRGVLQQASGFPALSVRLVDLQLSLDSTNSARAITTASAVNGSRTYLRTARLRL
jgi:hypothetical protein